MQRHAVHRRRHGELAHAPVDVAPGPPGSENPAPPPRPGSGCCRSGLPTRRSVPARPRPAPPGPSCWRCGWRPSARRPPAAPSPRRPRRRTRRAGRPTSAARTSARTLPGKASSRFCQAACSAAPRRPNAAIRRAGAAGSRTAFAVQPSAALAADALLRPQRQIVTGVGAGPWSARRSRSPSSWRSGSARRRPPSPPPSPGPARPDRGRRPTARASRRPGPPPPEPGRDVLAERQGGLAVDRDACCRRRARSACPASGGRRVRSPPGRCPPSGSRRRRTPRSGGRAPRVEGVGQDPFRQRHADGVGQRPWPSGPGGWSRSAGVAVFRMTGGARSPLAEGPQLPPWSVSRVVRSGWAGCRAASRHGRSTDQPVPGAGQCGAAGSNFRCRANSTFSASAIPIRRPGSRTCPLDRVDRQRRNAVGQGPLVRIQRRHRRPRTEGPEGRKGHRRREDGGGFGSRSVTLASSRPCAIASSQKSQEVNLKITYRACIFCDHRRAYVTLPGRDSVNGFSCGAV